MGGGGGLGWRVLGGGFWRVWGGGSQGAYAQPTTTTFRGGCVSGAGLGKLLVAVVKQGLQMGRLVVIFHFATNDIC